MLRSPIAPVAAEVMASPTVVADVVVAAGGQRWRRVLLRTPWLSSSDDLGAAVADALDRVPDGAPRVGDVVAVAEKVAVVTSGRVVAPPRPGRLARLLARAVRPVGQSCGLSLPAKMQYVVDDVGRARVMVAAAVSALTRPLGVGGAFYRVAGTTARDLDGMRGAYAGALVPPLTAGEAGLLAHHLSSRLGRAVAIVDVNDRGGSVRAVPPGGPDASVLLTALADNPHGQCEHSTPVVLLRPLLS